MKKGGMFKSEKRKKELVRQKKQEEKRLKRLRKADGTEEKDETAVPVENEGSSATEEVG